MNAVGIPFGEALRWDKLDRVNNFYYNAKQNVRIYYYNTKELSHTYKVQDPIVKEADCTNEGYICKEYIDEEQTDYVLGDCRNCYCVYNNNLC